MHLLRERGFVHPLASEITPRAAYLNRRRFVGALATTAAPLLLPFGAASAQAEPADADYFAGLRDRVGGRWPK